MALWDTDTGTHCVQGHLASAKIYRRYYNQEGWKFSLESIDSLKLSIKSHPLVLASPLWQVIALIWPGQQSTPNPYPCCRADWEFGEVQGTRIKLGFQKVAVSQLTEIDMKLSSLWRTGRRDLCYNGHLSNGCSPSQMAALNRQNSSFSSKRFKAWACQIHDLNIYIYRLEKWGFYVSLSLMKNTQHC